MKWIILLLVVSCGKHQEPPPQPMVVVQKPLKKPLVTKPEVRPAEEKPVLIREIQPVKNISAYLTFWNGRGHETLELIASTNSHQLVSDLLVKNKRAILKEEFDLNKTYLRMNKYAARPELDSPNQIELKLEFDRVMEEPAWIGLIHSGREISRLKWQKQVSVKLTGYELNAFFRGELKISLQKDQPNDRNEVPSFRVYQSNGFESKILEISEELSFEEYLDQEKIIAHDIAEVDLLSILPHNQIKKWWKRQTPFGWSLGYFSLNELKGVYLRGFKLVAKQIGRKEGVSLAPAIFKKDPEARMFMKIRPVSQKTRSFSKKTTDRRIGPYIKCTQDLVTLSKENAIIPNVPSIISQLQLRDDGRKAALAHSNVNLVQTKDQSGAYLYVIPKNQSREFELSSIALSKKQFTATGITKDTCSSVKPRIISNEKQLLIKVETFVEKL